MPSITEKLHPGAFILSLANGQRSIDNKTLSSGQKLLAAAVIGAITAGAVTSAAKAGGNTGNGTITLDATSPKRQGAKVGVYTVRCITAATNGGVFRVEDPDGFVIGECTISGGAGGTASFDDDIKFVLTDGGTDFVVGDGFDVTIAAGTGKLKELAPTAEDGTQIAIGLMFADVDASATGTNADTACAIVARDAEVNTNEVVWPAGITSPQKTAAIAQLAALGIVLR